MATVLVVDDEFGIAELFEAVLSDAGHRVVTASNGKHGLEVLMTLRPDVAFIDYMMPVMDGSAMLQAMAESATLKDIPVVLMSSIPEATVAERCRGYVKFMRKPFSVFHVIDVVDELVKTF